jgi:heme-degrading monooxygenase HmoA
LILRADIADSLRNLAGSVESIVYRTVGDAGTPTIWGIFCAVDSQFTLPEPSQIHHLLAASLGEQLEVRVYETIPSGSHQILPTSRHEQYMVFNGMTPNDSAEETFNDWYSDEHIPMLSAVPGWHSSRRFRLLSATSGPPRYLALHEWDDLAAFQTPEFRAATNTPWRTRVVVEQVSQKERFVFEYQGAVDELL